MTNESSSSSEHSSVIIPTTVAVTTVVAASSIVLVTYLWKKNNNKKHRKQTKQLLLNNNEDSKEEDNNNVTIVELLPIEQTLAMGGGGGDNNMATLTWFRGTSSNDDDDDDCQTVVHVQKSLLKRIKEIIHANPWLTGRIVKRHGSFVLQYDNNPSSFSSNNYQDSNNDSNYNKYLECRDENEISRDVPLNQLGSTLSHLLLTNGPTEPLWKVTILPCRRCCQKSSNNNNHDPSSSNKTTVFSFALVCSMSHVVADGYTYYKILNMLTFAEPVIPLDVKRIVDSQNQQIQIMGGQAEYSLLQSAGFILCMVRGVLKSMFFFLGGSPKPTTLIYKLNQTAIQKAKEEQQQEATAAARDRHYRQHSSTSDDHDGDVEFVSTNDILTSWFFTNSNCKYGLMAINFRGRLPGHSNEHAGNYENVLFYRRPDSTSPTLIRKSLLLTATGTTTTDDDRRCLQRVVTNDQCIPGLYEMAMNGSFAMVTNWSSFSKPPCLDGCYEEVHIPLYNVASMLPSTMAIMLIFRAGGSSPNNKNGQLGVLMAGTPNQLRGLQDSPFLMKSVLC